METNVKKQPKAEAMDELLTTREVAQQLQVSESSVKRWCDQGIIRTLRTAGGHRRIARGGLDEFLESSASKSASSSSASKAAEGTKPAVRREDAAVFKPLQVAEAAETYAAPSQQDYVQKFQQALVAGNEQLCLALMESWLKQFPGVARLGDALISESMNRIGQLWQCGRADVFEERRSCEICIRLLHTLRSRAPLPSARAPRAIGGTVAGDHYALANQLVELVLREAGWNAVNLGGNLPFDALLAAVRREAPRMLWLSVSHVQDKTNFVAEYNVFYSQLPADLVVAVGGRALTDELRPQIGYTAHCDSLEQLSALAQAISTVR